MFFYKKCEIWQGHSTMLPIIPWNLIGDYGEHCRKIKKPQAAVWLLAALGKVGKGPAHDLVCFDTKKNYQRNGLQYILVYLNSKSQMYILNMNSIRRVNTTCVRKTNSQFSPVRWESCFLDFSDSGVVASLLRWLNTSASRTTKCLF